MNREKVYLGIDTSTTNCSVALFGGGQLLEAIDHNDGYSHSENLAPFVDQVLQKHGLSVADLNGIGVGVGPGSYTGLRIGVSFVKGLAFANDIPVVSFTSLELLLNQVLNKEEISAEDLIIPMIDARRQEVFTQVFDGGGSPLSDVFAEILTPQSFANYINGRRKIICVGNGAGKVPDLEGVDEILRLDAYLPSGSAMNNHIEISIAGNRVVDLAYFEPFYLKEFVAGKPKSVILKPE